MSLLCAASLWARGVEAAPLEFSSRPGPFAVEVQRFEWTEPARQRGLPVKVYYPSGGTNRFAVIIFSHGLGGTREGYEYLGRHWASHGYVSVHLQHPGSDDAVWRGSSQPLESMREAAATLRNAIERPLDVRFAIDQLESLAKKDSSWNSRLDLGRIGVAGHSFGAYTTLAVAGQTFGPGERSLADSRVKAAIAMSSPVPKRSTAANYSRIQIPVFHLTGTEDNSAIGDTLAAERRVPFERINGTEQYLVIFAGGDHMVFSGRRTLQGTDSKDYAFQEFIKVATTVFWDAWLGGDATAKAWLRDGGMARALGEHGTLEIKRK